MAETSRLTPAIRCEALSKRFDGRPILKAISFDVAQGEVLAIMGRSGSGKSTLLRLLSLIEKADDGNAWLNDEQYLKDGEAVAEPVHIRRRIAMVFQQFNLFPNFSVLDNCTLGPMRALGVSKLAAESEARLMLESLGLLSLADRYPETLSGGEAQRVALARALLMRPDVLLLDEITSLLDPESIGSVLAAVRRIRSVDQAKETAIVLVTHHLAFAQSFADQIAFLDDGGIADLCVADRFEQQAASDAARKFIEQARSPWR